MKEYPSVDDSEAKKRLHGVWTVWFIVEWFTVADFLYAFYTSAVVLYSGLSTILFVNREIHKTIPNVITYGLGCSLFQELSHEWYCYC